MVVTAEPELALSGCARTNGPMATSPLHDCMTPMHALQALREPYTTTLMTHVLAVWEIVGERELARRFVTSQEQFVARAIKYVKKKAKTTMDSTAKDGLRVRLETPPAPSGMCAIVTRTMSQPILKFGLAGRLSSEAALCDALKTDVGGCSVYLATHLNACLVAAFTVGLQVTLDNTHAHLKLSTSLKLDEFLNGPQGDAATAEVLRLAKVAPGAYDRFVFAQVAGEWEKHFRKRLAGEHGEWKLTAPVSYVPHSPTQPRTALCSQL